MGLYNDMTRLACFVAQVGMDKWERSDVEFMVEECGWEAADDFYERYENTFGVGCAQQREWIAEIAEEEEEED